MNTPSLLRMRRFRAFRVLWNLAAAMMLSGIADIAHAQCAPMPAPFVSWWQAEDNATDRLGINNGTLVNGLGFATGEVGHAFNFTAAGQEVSIPASLSLDVGPGPGLTIEGWINPVDAINQYPLAEWNGSSIGAHFWISVSYLGYGGQGSLYASLSAAPDGIFATGAGVIQAAVWQHVAMTYDKSSGMARLYRNGAEVTSTNLGEQTAATAANFHLGTRPGGPSYRGLMDEFALYSRALSAAELQAIYDAGSAGKCPPFTNVVLNVGPDVRNFGFQNLRVNNKLALGHRPLLVVVVDFAGASPLAHTAAWYDSFVFDLSPTNQSVNGYYTEISNGRFFWSRGATIGPLALPGSNRYGNFPNDTAYASNLVWQAMVSGLFDFQAYDVNGDGHVTQDELQLAIISNDGDGGGAERWAGQVRPDGSQVDWTGGVALLGHRGDFATLCHELSHTLGTLDLYGVWSQECLSYYLTLMSCTLGALESPDIYHLDPWHKMQLGWSEPRIFSLNASGSASLPSAQSLEATGPVILYDPSFAPSEFFILEYRTRNTPQGGGYDVNVADEGLAIWHIHQEANRYPTLTPRYDGGLLLGQENWRWCSKCQGMHFISASQNPSLGPCPAGGVHAVDGSGGYMIVQNISNAPGQHGWRWCHKCRGLFFGPATVQSHCPANGAHDGSSSGDYSLVQNENSSPGQHGWKLCNKCQGLFYGPRMSESRCPSDNGLHNDTGSGDYAMLLSGLNYAVWSEGPLNFGRGSSTLWHSDQTTPQLVRLDGTRTKTRLHVRPFTSGAGFITVDWLSELDTPPLLRIVSTTTNAAVISWPAACTDFSLEQSASVWPPNWTSVTNLPVTVGIENQVTVLPPVESRFYRLRSL